MIAAGLWLENVSRADAHRLLDTFESAQLPVFLVFFALAGSHIDVYALYASLLPIAILAFARIGSFFVGCRVATARTHARGPIDPTICLVRAGAAGRPRARHRDPSAEVVS